ncbi:aminoacetone oxidase family FAD-binding enzyme [candidate division WOR-3 bacterium]|nr:aminoacetone oxidase family FAD-binding enzyme [candidate division WOR-3 bacterium]
MSDVIDLAVIGGGAAGLACALEGGRLGLRVLVLEKTARCGNKVALTGGKRCNFTHLEAPNLMAKRFDCPREKILPLLRRFPPQEAIKFFQALGIEPQVDEDGCVWVSRKSSPLSIKARDRTLGRDNRLSDSREQGKTQTGAGVLRERLVGAVLRVNGEIRTMAYVSEILPGWWVVLKSGEKIKARSVVVATGGASYPQTGSTGDGNRLVQALGIKTTPFFPALAALMPAEAIEDFAGISHPAVEVRLNLPNVAPRQGNFIFAHKYISGSAVMNMSGFAARALMGGEKVRLSVDWVPDKSYEELKAYFNRLRQERPLIQAKTALTGFVARKIATFICYRADVVPDSKLSNLSKVAVSRLIEQLKGTSFEIIGTEPIERATVTGGGVSLDEVDMRTMEAVRFPGLFIIGEALDIWAETGGYNLHFAWASGVTAARAMASSAGTGG